MSSILALLPALPSTRLARCSVRRGGLAFTLVEVYVSLLVVAVALAISASLVFEGRRHQADALATTKAVFLADTLLSEVQVTPPAARAALATAGRLPNTDRFVYTPSAFEWTRRIEATPEGACRAVVSVAYRLPGEQASRSADFSEEFYP